MATIADLSDTPEYTIKAVSQQTGIRPVTLRAWERRYQLVRPRRSAGNYRLYSEREVALLRWLKRRLDAGVAVSQAAAELKERRRSGRWPEALAPLPRPPAKTTAAAPPGPYSQRLFDALTGHAEAAAAAVLNEAHAVFDLTAICQEIIAPCLAQIGAGWERGEIRVSTEHFASTYLRGWLLGLLQSYATPRAAPHVVLACAAGELHELGLLMLALLLRRAGYRAEFLGPDVPTADLLDYAREARPAMLCVSAGADEPAREVPRIQAGLARLRPRPAFGYGGRAFNLRPELRRAAPDLFLGETAAAACAAVQARLPLGV